MHFSDIFTNEVCKWSVNCDASGYIVLASVLVVRIDCSGHNDRVNFVIWKVIVFVLPRNYLWKLVQKLYG